MERGDVEFVVMALCKCIDNPDRNFAVPIKCRGHVTSKYEYSPDSLSFHIHESSQKTVIFTQSRGQRPSEPRIFSEMWATHDSFQVTNEQHGDTATLSVTFEAEKW